MMSTLYNGFLDDSAIKIYLPMQETRVRSLSQEDPLEEAMATHSSLLAWDIPWTEEPGGFMLSESDTT